MNNILNKWLSAATLILCGAMIIGCNNTPAEPQSTDTVIQQEKESFFSAITPYLVDEIGSQYSEAEYCIPSFALIGIDETDFDETKVWGDFWVFNYNIVGDTLKCVSGGNHPGLMHIQTIDNHYKVTAFDQVEDGAANLASAKRIFGGKYEAFQTANSDEELRETIRAKSIALYVMKNNIPATMYQDYGWPAKPIPEL